MEIRALLARFRVLVYARGQGQASVTEGGATSVSEHEALASGCDIFGVCLFNDAQVRGVLI